MSRYYPPGGDRVQVAVAETVHRARERKAIRAHLLAARRAGLRLRHAEKLRRLRAGDTTTREE